VDLYVIFLDRLGPVLVEENFSSMRQPSFPKNANEAQEKVPFLVAKRIREAILDEVFKPGDRLGEVGLAEKFEVSRLLKHFPTARPAEILMEIYRKGKIAESFQAFKKIYLEILDEVNRSA
jgi:Bacterial regulatory proteins, gntR family